MMDVVYSAANPLGGGGLAHVVARAVTGIYRAGYLKKTIVYGNRQREVPKRYILNAWFQPTKVFSSLPARYYYSLKRIQLDWVTARWIGWSGCDLFHGWSHASLQSLKMARRLGAIGLVERASPHPDYTDDILSEEYERFGARGQAGWTWYPMNRIDAIQRDRTTAVEEFDLANYIVVQSDFVARTLIDRGIEAGKVVTIPRAADCERFSPLPGEPPARPFRVIYVGEASIRKGIRYLIEAWRRLKLRDAELLIVGSVHDEVKPWLATLPPDPTIRFTGFVPDPERCYQESSVFALPSLIEGSAKVTYEAMACGLPAIVTPNAGSPVRDGVDGYVVPIRDIAAIEEKIRLLYDDEERRRMMGRQARARALEFTWDRYERSLIEAYDRIWAKTGRA